jgi:hypothetical protein
VLARLRFLHETLDTDRDRFRDRKDTSAAVVLIAMGLFTVAALTLR